MLICLVACKSYIWWCFCLSPYIDLKFPVFAIGTYHIIKVETGGEDAFFVGGDAGGVFAIADGVSGYAIFAAMNSVYFWNRSNEV